MQDNFEQDLEKLKEAVNQAKKQKEDAENKVNWNAEKIKKNRLRMAELKEEISDLNRLNAKMQSENSFIGVDIRQAEEDIKKYSEKILELVLQ